MKYEQEDLLEKFIHNEKRSKIWALVSAVAFTLVAVTVLYVAKESNKELKKENEQLQASNEEMKNRLSQYEGKTPTNKSISILIKYTSSKFKRYVDLLEEQLDSKFQTKINFSEDPNQQKLYPVVYFFNLNDKTVADDIVETINNLNPAKKMNYKSKFVDKSSDISGYFEIMLSEI